MKIAEYEYNALNWRTIKRIDTFQPGSWHDELDELDEERVMLYAASADCGAGDYSRGHSDFSGVGNDGADLAKNWNARGVYKNLPIGWPGDPKKDPCTCGDAEPEGS